MNNLTLNPLLKYILYIFFLLPGMANAQYVNLNGKITDAETLKPLANAEVYIANTTIRAKTDTNGTYTISNLPTGSYELLAWAESYETKGMDVAATIGNKTVNIALSPRITALPEVTISRSGIWKENLARFKREFIGLSPQANYKILNEYLLDLDYSSKTQLLTARTDDFLEIENLTLGYKLRFLIKEFWADYNAGTYHYSGSVIFEELSGTEEERKKWIKNRYNVYEGSFRHFMTALTSNRVKENGFVLRRLLRTPNPKRPPDSLILYKTNTQFKDVANNRVARDSAAKWVKIWKLPKIIETLEKYDVPAIAITKPGKLPQTYDLIFKDYLYIIYKNIVLKPSLGFIIPNPKELHRFDEAGSFQIAAISMKTPEDPITFNDKGIQISKGRIFYEGAWNESRILGLLPFDYIPSKN